MEFITALIVSLRLFLLRVAAVMVSIGVLILFWFLFWKYFLRELSIVQDLLREFAKPQTENKVLNSRGIRKAKSTKSLEEVENIER